MEALSPTASRNLYTLEFYKSEKNPNVKSLHIILFVWNPLRITEDDHSFKVTFFYDMQSYLYEIVDLIGPVHKLTIETVETRKKKKPIEINFPPTLTQDLTWKHKAIQILSQEKLLPFYKECNIFVTYRDLFPESWTFMYAIFTLYDEKLDLKMTPEFLIPYKVSSATQDFLVYITNDLSLYKKQITAVIKYTSTEILI